jgi:hypothetical protein
LTKCGNLSEAEVEEMEMVVVAVKTAKMTEMAAVMVTTAAMTVKAAAMLKMATTAESAEMAAAVMTTAEKVVVDITDGKDDGRRHIGENAGS